MKYLQKIVKALMTGNSLSVPMTKQLKMIGVSRGDSVYVYVENNKIIIERLGNDE